MHKITKILALSAMLTTNLFSSNAQVITHDMNVKTGQVLLEETGEKKQFVSTTATLLDYKDSSDAWLSQVVISTQDWRGVDKSLTNAQNISMGIETRLAKNIFLGLGVSQNRTIEGNQATLKPVSALTSLYSNWNSGKHSIQYGLTVYPTSLRKADYKSFIPLPLLAYSYDINSDTSISLGYDKEASLSLAYQPKYSSFSVGVSAFQALNLPVEKTAALNSAPTLEAEFTYQITSHFKVSASFGGTFSQTKEKDALETSSFDLVGATARISAQPLAGVSFNANW